MAQRKYVILTLLLLPLIGWGQVPNTDNFTLQDVVNVISPTNNTLQGCFNDAVDSEFDIKHKGDKDRLSNFRNYGSDQYVRVYPSRTQIGIDEGSNEELYFVYDYTDFTDTAYTLGSFVERLYDENKNYISSYGTWIGEYTIQPGQINELDEYILPHNIRNDLEINNYSGSYIDTFYYYIEYGVAVLEGDRVKPFPNDSLVYDPLSEGSGFDDYKEAWFLITVVEHIGPKGVPQNAIWEINAASHQKTFEIHAVGNWSVSKVDMGSGTYWFDINNTLGTDYEDKTVTVQSNPEGTLRMGRLKVTTQNGELLINIYQSG